MLLTWLMEVISLRGGGENIAVFELLSFFLLFSLEQSKFISSIISLIILT